MFISFPSLQDDQQRGAFFEKLSHLFTKLLQYAPVDAAADQVSWCDTKIHGTGDITFVRVVCRWELNIFTTVFLPV